MNDLRLDSINQNEEIINRRKRSSRSSCSRSNAFSRIKFLNNALIINKNGNGFSVSGLFDETFLYSISVLL